MYNLLLPYLVEYGIFSVWDTTEHRRLPSDFSEGIPFGRKKGGIINGYICGLVPNIVIHCRPYRSDLSDTKGQKKIAATTENSDG